MIADYNEKKTEKEKEREILRFVSAQAPAEAEL